jgi:hypothetical protein
MRECPPEMTAYRWLALGFVFVLASSAKAQSSVQDSACSYDRCAVWLDRGNLRRGADATVVLRDGFFRSMRLEAFFGGSDSATVWAGRFERRASTANKLSGFGLLAMGAGFGMQYLRVRNRTSGIDDGNGFEASLVLGGYLSFLGGAIVRMTAQPMRGRAIWWYNRRFASGSGSQAHLGGSDSVP